VTARHVSCAKGKDGNVLASRAWKGNAESSRRPDPPRVFTRTCK
jgi:hypothetical protein